MREMKDSGIEWIGEIPKDWAVYRGGYLYKIETGSLDVNAENPDGLYPFFTCSMFPKRINEWRFDCEALLVAGNGIVGYTQYYNGKFNAYQRSYVLSDFKNIYPAYLKHYVSNNLITEVAPKSQGSVIQFIKYNDLRDFHVVAPCVELQKIISDYLDTKCSEIDALTADIEKEIETLEEYKRSVIYQAVTHGINGEELEKTESEYWKDIPKEWQLKDIKYIFEIVKRIAGKEGYDVLAVTQQGIKVKDLSGNEGQLAADYSGYQFVYPGDYAMNHMDLLTGWVDLSNTFGVTSPDYRVFRLRDAETYDRKYYLYVMQCCYMNRIFYSMGQGVSNLGRWRLQTSAFNDFKVPVPPYENQVAIGAFLDKVISDVNNVIGQKKKQLETLSEYKKSLIYEYVTGKKEVPNNER